MKIAVALAITVSLALPAIAGAQTLDLTKRYNVLARKDTRKLERDLNKAGQNGFRVVAGSTTGSEEVTLLLEKVGEDSFREYIVVSAGNTKKLEQQIGHAAVQGYRLLPNTVTSKSKILGSGDLVMVLERAPGQEGNWEYLLLDTAFGSSLQVTLSGAVDQGFQILGMIRKKSQALLILGKPAA